ncbi:AraC family transcriptional regulator, partial [Pseudomonas aeruginosa]|nr:AraC family transcriptional regulator [Pseudomonas aeruginosa]
MPTFHDIDFVAAERARQYIHAHLERALSLDEL